MSFHLYCSLFNFPQYITVSPISHIFNILLYSLSCIPENRIYLAEKRNVILQICTVIEAGNIHSDSTVTSALLLLVNMARCKEAQKHLLQEEIIENVLESLFSRRFASLSDRTKFEMKLPW